MLTGNMQTKFERNDLQTSPLVCILILVNLLNTSTSPTSAYVNAFQI